MVCTTEIKAISKTMTKPEATMNNNLMYRVTANTRLLLISSKCLVITIRKISTCITYKWREIAHISLCLQETSLERMAPGLTTSMVGVKTWYNQGIMIILAHLKQANMAEVAIITSNKLRIRRWMHIPVTSGC